MSYESFDDSPFLMALKQRGDLAPFNENKLAAFGIELCFGIDDPISSLLPAVTGTGGDAKIDILFVSRELGVIVLCQVYESLSIRKSAKGNKGVDLGHAMSVMFATDENILPAAVAPQIKDAREAIRNGDIRAIHVWFAHNCPESVSIQKDMSLCFAGAKAQLNLLGEAAKNISLQIREVGLESLDSFYRASSQVIAVEDEFNFINPRKGFIKSDADWKTYITTVPGAWLSNVYRQYESKGLYNPNVRGFMGANNKDTDRIINAGIQGSAKNNPNDFFVFNNGITALVHDFTVDNAGDLVSIKGLGIVNGAQTTGSLGELDDAVDLTGIEVGVRFIKCENKETVKSITRYNNSQNKVIQSDFRANDAIQNRLRDEFQKLGTAEYDGGLRGHPVNNRKIKLDAHTAAQALTAWHGNPYDSYHNKMQIWDLDEHYKIAFNETITATHILFVYTLNEAANLMKAELQQVQKHNVSPLTQDDLKLLAYLNERGSSFMIVHAVQGLIETIIDSKIVSPYKLGFKKSVSKDDAIIAWKDFLKIFSRYIIALAPGLNGRLSNKGEIQKARDAFIRDAGTIADIMKGMPQNPYSYFTKKIDNTL